MAYGYGGKYLQDGGMMRKKMQMGDPLVPVVLPTQKPLQQWEGIDRNTRYDIDDYLQYRNNQRKNQGKKPLDWNTPPTDAQDLKDWNNQMDELRRELDQYKEYYSNPKNKRGGSSIESWNQMMKECPDYNCPELLMKMGGFTNRFYQTGGPMVPTYQDAWRNRQYSQPVNEDYYGETSHITADKTTPYRMGGMMDDNKYMGYSRNQSLYGGMINTKTSPFWGGYRTKGQEGMEMEQPQPQGDPQLAQARQAMLQGAGQPQGPVADPMMEDMLMQQMEQGAMPPQGGQQMQQPQPTENPIMMLAQALPDWFKTSESQGGLGIFTQPAVAQLRKAGFSDREIATFNPNQVDPNSPIVQFLAEEASSSQGAQGMQPEMQQMRRGGSMKHLRKGEYVKFQMGGTVYEGKVKYYDPYTGNFELDDNY
jgi:hypothetical protein